MSRSARWRVLRLLSIRGCSWTMQECKHYSGGNILSDGGFHKTRRGVQIISVGTRRVNLLTLSSVLQSTCILNLHFSIYLRMVYVVLLLCSDIHECSICSILGWRHKWHKSRDSVTAWQRDPVAPVRGIPRPPCLASPVSTVSSPQCPGCILT